MDVTLGFGIRPLEVELTFIYNLKFAYSVQGLMLSKIVPVLMVDDASILATEWLQCRQHLMFRAFS